MIAKHVGNKVQTTAHYAHLARDSVEASAQRIAVSLAADVRVAPDTFSTR